MAEALAGLQGHFVLSLNDRPEVRKIFAAFDIASVATQYGLTGKGATAAAEVIITNRGR